MKIIIDTDAGVDDAVAIILALTKLRDVKAEILAITTVFGNVNVNQAAINVGKILTFSGISIPIYKNIRL